MRTVPVRGAPLADLTMGIRTIQAMNPRRFAPRFIAASMRELIKV